MAMTNRPVTCNVCDQCGVAAEADHVKDPRCVTRKTHARFTDSLSISGWTGGVSAAVLMIPVGPSAVVLMVPVGLSAPGLAALAAGYCAQLANCFGAPLVGARGFLGFRPLLFGMEPEPAYPQAQHSSLSKILLNIQVPWVDQDHATTERNFDRLTLLKIHL